MLLRGLCATGYAGMQSYRVQQRTGNQGDDSVDTARKYSCFARKCTAVSSMFKNPHLLQMRGSVLHESFIRCVRGHQNACRDFIAALHSAHGSPDFKRGGEARIFTESFLYDYL